MKRHFLTSKGPKAVGPYSTAVIYNGMVFLSGVIPADPETGAIVSGGIEKETDRVMENIKIILSELGLNLGNVIKTNIFLSNMDDFAKVNAVYKSAFEREGVTEFPARSCVQVARLPLSVGIEIEMIAET